jgi:hypothetical protein
LAESGRPEPVEPAFTPTDPRSQEGPLGDPLEVPTQTPYFHAIERDRYKRQEQIRAIEQHTGRRLICYVSTPWGEITRDIVPVFGDLLDDVDASEDLDLLLQTSGGDIDAAEKIVMMCRARCAGFRVIVPESAKSAGTMMACAADAVVMGYASELGPIDPQIRVPDAQGQWISRPAHSFLSGLESIKKAAVDENGLSPAYFPLLDKLDPALLDFCDKSITRARAFAEKWLQRYQLADKPDAAAELAKNLGDVERFPSHGAAIDADQATEMGFVVERLQPDDPLWQALWRLFTEYDLFLRINQRTQIFESGKASIQW